MRSTSDTEVVLEAILAWGEDALLRFRGEFAFALIDRQARRVFLARDPAGVKPLYWALSDGRLAVTSEIKALVGSFVHRGRDRPRARPGPLRLGRAGVGAAGASVRGSAAAGRGSVDDRGSGGGQPARPEHLPRGDPDARRHRSARRRRAVRWAGQLVDAAARARDASRLRGVHDRHRGQRGPRLRAPPDRRSRRTARGRDAASRRHRASRRPRGDPRQRSDRVRRHHQRGRVAATLPTGPPQRHQDRVDRRRLGRAVRRLHHVPRHRR